MNIVRWERKPGQYPMLKVGSFVLGWAFEAFDGWAINGVGFDGGSVPSFPDERTAQIDIERRYGLPDLPKVSAWDSPEKST